MDDLYENLDNYNEETTIAELQTENKELKSKLEEYAVTLTKLQKEFDKLSAEYKQLELNYSSLLKTAKAEIERKTKIITNLNLEKDKMVLKSFQNKNASVLYKSRDCDNPKVQQNFKKDNNDKTKQDEKLKQFVGRKSSLYSETESKEQDEPTCRDTTASPHTDLRSKLLNIAHRGQQHDPRTEKNSNLKENIMLPIKESDSKARASIRNRRKSMPAKSIEAEQTSDEGDEITSVARSKNLQPTYTEHNISEKQKHIDYNFYERPRSRMSDTSSLDEKKSGYHELIHDNLKQRSSRYDRGKNDKYRVRHKSSHRSKRLSPDGYQSRSREYNDPYHRSEYDRHRAIGLESPPRDTFHQRPSRELHRNKYERPPYEQDRLLPRSQERYQMKRRIESGYDEYENKRVKVEPYSRQHEEVHKMKFENKRLKESQSRHLEEDRRMKDERKHMEKKSTADPLEIQFSSCESPDYVNPDISNQQVKEIKFTATTKLDDPRVSSKKYVVKKNDGQVTLNTAIGRNVEIVPFRKNAWGITSVSMPEALVTKPPEPQHSARDVHIEIEHPANISIESGEISDVEFTNSQNPQKVNKPNNGKNEPLVPVIKFDVSKDVEKSLKKINSYKIPKFCKSADDKQSSTHFKETMSSVNLVHDNTDSFKSNNNEDIDVDSHKQQTKIAKGKKKPQCHIQDSLVVQNKNQLPCLGISNIYEQNYPTAKEVVEGDLEMSDDNCDDNDQSDYVTKEAVVITKIENKTKDKSCNMNTEKQRTDASEKVSQEPCKDKTPTGASEKVSQELSKDKTHAGVIEKLSQKPSQNKTATGTSEKVSQEPCKDKTPTDASETKSQEPSKDKTPTDPSVKKSQEPCKEKTPTTDGKKPKNKKKHKHKETIDAHKSEGAVKSFEKPAKKKEKKKETKSIQIKTKFSELFDDSSSLISPEDLGLAAVPAPTTRLPDKCVPFFEDALDASDLITIKCDTIKDSAPTEKLNAESKCHNDVTATKYDTVSVIQEDSIEKSNNVETEMTDDIIKSIYQNLEPGVPEEQGDVVKTVIISSGVQPPILLDDEKQQPSSKPEPQLKTIQDVGLLKALATSTPHKIGQTDIVMGDTETKLADSGCNSNNNSQITNVENTATMDKSDSNTMDSQTNDANVPDVRIFVKRRRKVIKK